MGVRTYKKSTPPLIPQTAKTAPHRPQSLQKNQLQTAKTSKEKLKERQVWKRRKKKKKEKRKWWVRKRTRVGRPSTRLSPRTDMFGSTLRCQVCMPSVLLLWSPSIFFHSFFFFYWAGLDEKKHKVLEIAVVVTDNQLNVIAEVLAQHLG